MTLHARAVQAKDTYEMDSTEKLSTAAKMKEDGNAAFKAGAWTRAVKRYVTML